MSIEEKGKLKKKIRICGKIVAETGLHIGGSNLGLSIGGADATVVRNPLNNQPYIPGSSLKGKMRSMLEKVEGIFGKGIGTDSIAGPAVNYVEHTITKIFGTTPEEIKKFYGKDYEPKKDSIPVTRIIVYDCLLNKDNEKLLKKATNTDMLYTEVKTEVVIDRITSAATPRQIERVPAGAIFEMEMILNVFGIDEDKDEEDMVNTIFEGLCLVQNDYMGGKGTRGSGKVNFVIEKLEERTADDYKALKEWHNYTKVHIPKELEAK